MASVNDITHNELELNELLSVLWAHKILIAIVTSAFFLCGVQYLLTAKTIYFQKPSTEIEEASDNGFDLSGELEPSSLSGLNQPGSSSTELLLERITNREFIRCFKQACTCRRPVFQSF